MNNKDFINPFGTMETKRVLNIDYPIESSSSGVPIPKKKNGDLNSLQDNELEIFHSNNDLIQDLMIVDDSNQHFFPINDTEWIGSSDELPFFQMDEDIFQMDADKSDMLHGPTLAELNSNSSESLLEDINLDDLLLLPDSVKSEISDTIPLMSSYLVNHVVNTSPVNRPSSLKFSFQLSPNICSLRSSLSSSSLNSVTLQEHLKKETKAQKCLSAPTFGTSVPGSGHLFSNSSRANISSSALNHISLEQKWQHREPRPHLLSSGSLVEAGSISSLSTGGVLSPGAYDFSLNEAIDDSDDDTEQEEDYSSNNGANSDYAGTSAKSSSQNDRFFWQYNVQSKGPKSQRLISKSELKDPYSLNEITDPVFSPDYITQGIKHCGKPRIGDGNDFTPNPIKLLYIGKELDKLNKSLNELRSVSDLPLDIRSNVCKEKNRLASRICRLKKKAQNEANKIYISGLNDERRHLMDLIKKIKQNMGTRLKTSDSIPIENREMINCYKTIVKGSTRLKFGGQTEFVNKVLKKTELDAQQGGLDEI